MIKDQKIYKKLVKIFLIIGIIFLCTGCIDIADENNTSKQKKDILVVAFFENGSINPLSLSSGNQLSIRPNIYNSLVEFDEDFNTIPALAESWNNPDDYTWRFYLRDDVKFHNGYDFAAEDVKFSIEEIFVSFSSFIDEVIIVDNHTIE